MLKLGTETLDVKEAASALGVTASGLYKRVKRYGEHRAVTMRYGSKTP